MTHKTNHRMNICSRPRHSKCSFSRVYLFLDAEVGDELFITKQTKIYIIKVRNIIEHISDLNSILTKEETNLIIPRKMCYTHKNTDTYDWHLGHGLNNDIDLRNQSTPSTTTTILVVVSLPGRNFHIKCIDFSISIYI